METSIIIRTKNEEKWISTVLEKLYRQTYNDFEIIVVDSGSIDRTLEIVSKYPVNLFQIKPEEFSYPYALNFGCRNAKAEKYFVFLSAHSLPISETWLQDGIDNFENETIAGVYCNVTALPDATIWEKLIFNNFWHKKEKIIVGSARMGVLGFTNAIIRRSLWEQRSLNEEYGKGGEDGEWAGYWMNKGYGIICDPRFAVYHSHGLGLIGLARQWYHWWDTATPGPYKKLNYRKK
jgi:rhamnosyltransferase